MHRSQHAGDESVYTIAFFDLWYESTDTAFIVGGPTKMSKDQFLKGINLILQVHQIVDSLVAVIKRITKNNQPLELNQRGFHEKSQYPSLGSSMFFNEMYSSYSNRPLNSAC